MPKFVHSEDMNCFTVDGKAVYVEIRGPGYCVDVEFDYPFVFHFTTLNGIYVLTSDYGRRDDRQLMEIHEAVLNSSGDVIGAGKWLNELYIEKDHPILQHFRWEK